MKLRGSKMDDAVEVLGPSAESELAFVVLPLTTYKALNDQARVEGCTTADVFSRALASYIERANQPKPAERKQPERKPDVVLKRNR